VAAVLALGLAITAYSLWRYPLRGSLSFWLLFISLAALAVLADRYSLQLTRGVHIHVDTIPLFASLLLFDPPVALIIAGLGRILGRIDRPIILIERLFNLGQTLLYMGASSFLLHLFTTTPWVPSGWRSWLGVLAAAGGTLFLNTGVVAGVIALQAGINPLLAWLRLLEPFTLLSQTLMICLGLLTALVVVPYPWGLALVALPSIGLFMMLDRTLRMEAHQKQLAEENAALARDLSQQAEKLREAYAILEDALEAKNQMVQNVSHELRTPLVSISGYTEALQEGLYGELTPDQMSALEVVLRNARTMIRLVNDLLSLQALDRRQLELGNANLAEILTGCAGSFAQRAAAAGIELSVECEPDLPTLRGDSVRLEQVVANLLDNAIKFSPNGGQVTVRAARLDDKTVQITVADQGIGIPEEELPKIYRRFYQVDSSSTRRFGGQGLGLAITKRIVELHGGTIRAESQVGKGTTFYVTLPVHGPEGTLSRLELD